MCVQYRSVTQPKNIVYKGRGGKEYNTVQRMTVKAKKADTMSSIPSRISTVQ